MQARRRTARIGEELECAKPMVNPKEHSVDVWMIFVRHKRVSPEKPKRDLNTGLGIYTISSVVKIG